MNLVFYGHHKAATSWLSGNFANLIRDSGWQGKGFNHLRFDEEDLVNIKSLQVNGRPTFFLVSNSCWSDREMFPQSKGIHLIRDPRDMIVSAYYSHRDSHPLFPGLAEERAKLKEVDLEEGLIVVMEGIMNQILKELGQWQFGVDKSIFEVRFEDLKKDGGKVIRDFLKFADVYRERDPFFFLRAGYNLAVKKVGLSPEGCWRVPYFSERSLRVHLERRDYKKSQTGSKKGHHRSGALKQWEKDFTPKVKEAFKSHFPNLPAQMGYEKDDTW